MSFAPGPNNQLACSGDSGGPAIFTAPSGQVYQIGVTHAGGKYHFTDRDFLSEGADALQTLGTRTIKIWCDGNASYPFNSHWPRTRALVEQLQPIVEIDEMKCERVFRPSYAANGAAVFA